MNRILIFSVTLLSISHLLAASAESPTPPPSSRRPNVVFILADDLGWRDLGVYRSTYHETPNIDRLVARGLRFTQAYAANPLCSPTRASILTGLYPARIGITAPVCHLPQEILEKGLTAPQPHVRVQVANSLTRLKPEYTTLAEVLRDAGYVTAHFGKWHLGHSGPYEPKDQGFQFDFPHTPQVPGPGGGYLAPWKFITDPAIQGAPGEHIEDRMSAEAARFIRNNKDRPFYLNYWCFSVHSPWSAKPELVEYFRQKADPNSPQRNPVYAAMVKSLDDAVGRIVAAIDECGLADQTIIIFFSDNGGFAYPPRRENNRGVETQPPGYADIPATSNLPLRSGKASIYEGGTRVPLIVIWPGHTQPGTVTDSLFSSVDFFPTILEMCGIDHSGYRVDGISQVAALEGKGAPRKEVFCHFPHGSENQARNIPGFLPSAYLREGDWKLIRFFAANPDGTDRFELYNLAEDIGESHNLADKYPERVNALRVKLEKYLADTEAVIPRQNPDYRGDVPTQDPLLGWKARNCQAEIRDGKLHLTATAGSPFLGFSVGRQHGPLQVAFHLKVLRTDGTHQDKSAGKVEWLPPSGERPAPVPYEMTSAGPQTVVVEVPWTQSIGIVRIYLPEGCREAEVDWIELTWQGQKKRFDF
ncbi:MAG: sulfatase [Thermogutta sp.]